MSFLDQSLQRLGEALTDEAARKLYVGKLLRRFKRFILVATIVYAAALFGISAAFRLIGENNLTLAFFLYFPRQVFLLPLPFLSLLALLTHWRLIPLQILIAILFMKFGMHWEWGSQPDISAESGKDGLTILTYNRGQHRNQSLQPFIKRVQPDIIAMQEARNRANRYAQAEGYEAFLHQANEAEFTVLSRYPIVRTEAIEMIINERPTYPAARFEIDFDERPVALYCIHIRTPRDTLRYYQGGAFLYGIIGIPGTPWAKKRQANQRFWDKRIDQARHLIEIMGNDPLPVLIAGDFNAPAGGYIHRLFINRFSDAHMEQGHGPGYTFPGITRNPLSLGGPWMRIDYLYADKKWETMWCITERDRPSQHRAVAARFKTFQSP